MMARTSEATVLGCRKCARILPTSEFYKSRVRTGRSFCKQCDSIGRRARHAPAQEDLDSAEAKLSCGLDGEGLSLKEVGAVMGITAERVRQIELSALRKLRMNAKVMAAVRRALEGRS